MLENLLFSVNMSLPLFVLLGLGMYLRKREIFTDDYVSRTTTIVYHYMLPAKMFLDVSAIDLSAAFDPRYLTIAAVCITAEFILAWVMADLMCKDRSKQSAMAHACYRGNFMYLGIALLQNIYGAQIVPSAAVIIILVVPFYNISGIFLMTVKESRDGFHPGRILLGVLKNPIVLSILLALPFAYFQIELPFLVTKSLGYLKSATSTLALLAVGASIKLETIRTDWRLRAKISSIKLLLMPAIAAAMAILAHLNAEQIVTLTVVCAMPSAINVFIVTDKMGGDGRVAGSAVVVTHLLSLFTMTAIVFALKTAGMI